MPSGQKRGRTRLYTDGVYPTPSGRARFVATVYAPPAEVPDAAYPVRLTTGRLRDQWHSMTRTGLVPRLFSHSPDPEIALHPRDLGDLGLADGELVRVASRRSSVVLKARASQDMRRGDAFVAMHWGSRHTSGAGTNALTLSAFDPHSRQPELKHAAIRVERFVAAWRCVILCAVDSADAAIELQRQLAPLLQRFDHAALAIAEGTRLVLSVELASASVPAAGDIAELDRLMELEQEDRVILYRDSSRGTERRARLADNAVQALRLTGEQTGSARLKEAMLSGSNVSPMALTLLAPMEGLAGLPPARGRTVCSCLDVRENEIRAAFAAGKQLAQVQTALKCGTQCGSCVPELKRLAAEAMPASVPIESNVAA
jgi:assimilatory nitrate reductase catalytic subunit